MPCDPSRGISLLLEPLTLAHTAPPPALEHCHGRDRNDGKSGGSKTQDFCSLALFTGNKPVGLELERLAGIFNDQFTSLLDNLLQGLAAPSLAAQRRSFNRR